MSDVCEEVGLWSIIQCERTLWPLPHIFLVFLIYIMSNRILVSVLCAYINETVEVLIWLYFATYTVFAPGSPDVKESTNNSLILDILCAIVGVSLGILFRASFCLVAGLEESYERRLGRWKGMRKLPWITKRIMSASFDVVIFLLVSISFALVEEKYNWINGVAIAVTMPIVVLGLSEVIIYLVFSDTDYPDMLIQRITIGLLYGAPALVSYVLSGELSPAVTFTLIFGSEVCWIFFVCWMSRKRWWGPPLIWITDETYGKQS